MAQTKAVSKAATKTGAPANGLVKKAPGKETAVKPAPATEAEALEKAARKQEKKLKKAQKKAAKKELKNKLKDKKSSTKELAGAFPMVALIDEQVRTSIPEELVAKVKAAKSKK